MNRCCISQAATHSLEFPSELSSPFSCLYKNVGRRSAKSTTGRRKFFKKILVADVENSPCAPIPL